MRATFSRRWRPILPKKSIDPGARCLRSRAFNETMMATASANVRVQVGDRLASSNALASLQRPEGAGMGVLFQHFPDSEAERDFVRSERADRAPAIRALIIIAIATLGSYIVMNPMHFPRAGVLVYTAAALAFIAILLGLFFVTKTEFYLARRWIDLPLFVAVLLGMIGLTKALIDQAAITGFPSHVMALIQMGILVIFAGVAFAGNVFLFFLWAAGVLALFSAWLFSLPVSPIGKVYALTNFTTFLIFALYFNWEIDRRARGVFAANRALARKRVV